MGSDDVNQNRERLQAGEVFEKFMTKLLQHPQVEPLLSDEHFSVDGTLIEAWASAKSSRPKDGGGGDGTDFHGQERKNDTHASTTDPESRLYRRQTGARPSCPIWAMSPWRTGTGSRSLAPVAGRRSRSASERGDGSAAENLPSGW